MAQERPVFFDPSGKRWRRAKTIAVILATLLMFWGGVIVTSLLQPIRILRPNIPKVSTKQYDQDNRSPAELAYSLNQDLPVIGEGVFLRVVRVENPRDGKPVAVDVYSGDATRLLSDEESQTVGNKAYAIERYGATSGKRIVLTFDDGPDPKYTPQILDILSEESAHSTFFPIGKSIVKYPELASRISTEGHDFANHTFSHADLDLVSSFQAEQEINQTQRIIREATGRSPGMFRIPYGGNDDDSIRDDRRAILEAQRLGYVVASYDEDSHDWGYHNAADIMLPKLKGDDKVVLLHDGGGNRTQTVAYLREFIPKAKAEGYSFTSLSRLYDDYKLNQASSPTISDKASYIAASAAFVWPKQIVHVLFIMTMVLIFATIVIGIILAEMQMMLMKPARRRKNYYPLVSVIIPAFNEEKVLQRTVEAVLRSRYRKLEVIIIDDGSTDGTWNIVRKLSGNNRVFGIWQQNSGKSAAVNRGVTKAKGEVVISLDADTIFPPKTVGKLVRYFYYPEIGAVAGVVKVGNIRNWITRWQALEYVTSINIERAAQAYLHAITVAPGACSAWRKEAIIRAGGYSSATLAEDCDLALAVQKAGYSVVQDMEAVAYTECPETIRGLARQRFRWLFGNIQAIWKHRDMLFKKRFGWLGLYILPKSILSIFMQLVFAPVLLLVTLGNLFAGDVFVILLYLALANIVLLLTAVVALVFARERFRYLTAMPAFRLVYSPLRTTILYLSVLAVLGGLELGWNKVDRTGSAMNIK